MQFFAQPTGFRKMVITFVFIATATLLAFL